LQIEGIQITDEISKEWMKNQIDFSNSKAAKNRNKYPIQEQATQMEIWECVPCTCDAKCSCKKFGCTQHWKLKENVQFDEFLIGFLRTFVDKRLHQNVIDALTRENPSKLNLRVKKAYPVLLPLKDEDIWKQLSTKASNHNKTLFCDGWAEGFREDWSYSVRQTSIYEAKKFCILFPDICVPYDFKSRKELITQFQLWNDDYFAFLSKIRELFMKCMEKENSQFPLKSLRSLDSPGDNLNFPEDNLPFDRKFIASPRAGMDYGTDYLPKERQLSFVLDKCYYQP
jgi:hypothetical protein